MFWILENVGDWFKSEVMIPTFENGHFIHAGPLMDRSFYLSLPTFGDFMANLCGIN